MNNLNEFFIWISTSGCSYILITAIPAIFTSFGISYKDIFKIIFANKNKNAFRYVLFNKVWDESFNSYIKRAGIYLLENFLIVIDALMLVGIVDLFAFFSNIALGKIQVNVSAVLGLMVTAVVFVAAFIGKYQYLQIFQKLKKLGLAVCESILIIMLMGLCFKNPKNLNACLCALLLVSCALGAAVIHTFYQLGVYRSYICNKYFSYIIKGIKYFMLMAYNYYFFMNYQNFENLALGRYIWFGMNLLEAMLVLNNDGTILAEATIYQKNKNETTKNKIIQYAGDKIGFKTLDGKEKIIDADKVEKIVYQKKHLFSKKYKSSKKVACILRNGAILQYQGYQLITDLWVQLYKTENGMMEVLLLKTQDVEEIVEEIVRKDFIRKKDTVTKIGCK